MPGVPRVRVPRVRTVRTVRLARVLKVRTVRKAPRAALLLGCLVLLGGCRHEDPPIRLNGAWLVVENETKMEWRDVSVTVNAYYKGVAPRVAPGGRLEAPLSGFVTGFGQRFNTSRERVRRVEVRATDAAGAPVALDWDEKTGPPLDGQINGR
jgi:hypothetical protein